MAKQILNGKIEVEVYLYETEEERNQHIEEMRALGWKCQKSGVANTHPSSNVTEYDKDENWHPFAEFHRMEESVKLEEPISYESGIYYFSLYKPVRIKGLENSNVIELSFSEELTHIAGYELGKKICEEQVIPNLRDGITNTLIIPKHIQMITSSFIEGFKSKVLDSNLKHCKVEFKANTRKLTDRLMLNYHR